MHDAHAPLRRNKIFCLFCKKGRKRLFRSDPFALFRICFTWKSKAALCVPCEQCASAIKIFYDRTHKIAIAVLKNSKNGRIFLQAPQCLTLYGYSKSPALYKRAGPLHWYRRISFKRYLQGRLLPRFAPLLDLIILLITKIAIGFDKDGKNGCQNSKFGRLFWKSLVYNSYFDVRFIKIFEIHYK